MWWVYAPGSCQVSGLHGAVNASCAPLIDKFTGGFAAKIIQIQEGSSPLVCSLCSLNKPTELHVNCSPHFGLMPHPPSPSHDLPQGDSQSLEVSAEGSTSCVIDGSTDGELSDLIGSKDPPCCSPWISNGERPSPNFQLLETRMGFDRSHVCVYVCVWLCFCATFLQILMPGRYQWVFVMESVTEPLSYISPAVSM